MIGFGLTAMSEPNANTAKMAVVSNTGERLAPASTIRPSGGSTHQDCSHGQDGSSREDEPAGAIATATPCCVDNWQQMEYHAIMTVTEAIRRAIDSTDVSFNKIANQTGVHRSALSRFMSRERGLDGSSLDKLAEYFGLELKPKAKKKEVRK
jgi:hypothetical protein